MARFEIKGPDGARYEVNAPEGATEQDALAYIQKQSSGGSSIADNVVDFGEQGIRGINRGLNSLASLPGALFGGAVNMVAPGQGDRFKLKNPVSDFMASEYAPPKTTAGRYGDAIGQAVGASVLPEAALLAKANQARVAGQQATTAMGRVGEQVLTPYRTAPGIAVAGDAAAAVGGGIGQQAAQDMGFGAAGQMVGGVAGGFVPGLAAAATRQAVQPVRQAMANQGEAGAYGKIARDLPDGIDQFADDVAVGATRRDLDVQRRTFDILGEEMVRTNGNVQLAEAATVQRLVRDHQLQPASARDAIQRLSSVHSESPLMLGEYPTVARADVDTRRVQPENRNFDDLNRVQTSETQGTIDYLANNGAARSATTTRNAIGARQDTLAPAVRETLERSGPQAGNRPASIVDSEQMIEQATQTARAAYGTAYRSPINNWELVSRLPRVLDATRNYAAGRAGDARTALNRAVDQFMLPTQNGPVAMGTLQQLQDARGVIRGHLTEYTRAGRDDLINAVQPFYDRITQLMTRASPAWRRANDQWADMNFLEIGERLGDAFTMRAGPQFRQQMREFQNLAPQAQDIVRIHFLQKLYDKIENLPDSSSVSKMFSSDHSRNMIRSLFGDRAAVDFTRMIRDVRVAEGTQRMVNGSQTVQRQERRRQNETETGLVAAVQNANRQGVINWILDSATQFRTELRNRPMGRILSTPMSDTARVAQHIQRMRQQNERLRQSSQVRPYRPPIGGLVAPGINPIMGEGGTR